MHSKLHEASTVLGSIADELNGTFQPGQDSHAERAHGYAKGWSERYAAERAQLPEIDLDSKALTVYVRASINNDLADGPTHAKFVLDQAFADEILRLMAVAIENKLAYAEVWGGPDWCDNGQHRIDCEIFSVSDEALYWRGHPKHSDFTVETARIGIKSLLRTAMEAVASGQSTVYFEIDDELRALIDGIDPFGDEYAVRVPLSTLLPVDEQAQLAIALQQAYDEGMAGRFAIGNVEGVSVVSFFRNKSDDGEQINENLAAKVLKASTAQEAVLEQLAIELEASQWFDGDNFVHVREIVAVLRGNVPDKPLVENLGDFEAELNLPDSKD
jgi:hypothetical protein